MPGGGEDYSGSLARECVPGVSSPVLDAGAWGPKEADEMLARRGHAWREP
jgi:hypothetical protein